MKRLLLAAAVVTLLAANSWAATSVKSSKSNSSFRLFPNPAMTTASTTFSNIAGAVVYTTPADEDFILTQFCADPTAPNGIRLDAANLGTIMQTVAGVSCYTFTPGLLLPHNSALTCSAPSASNFRVARATYFCTISGMQTTTNDATPSPTATPTPLPPS